MMEKYLLNQEIQIIQIYVLLDVECNLLGDQSFLFLSKNNRKDLTITDFSMTRFMMTMGRCY